jgi:hypothetical protein
VRQSRTLSIGHRKANQARLRSNLGDLLKASGSSGGLGPGRRLAAALADFGSEKLAIYRVRY